MRTYNQFSIRCVNPLSRVERLAQSAELIRCWFDWRWLRRHQEQSGSPSCGFFGSEHQYAQFHGVSLGLLLSPAHEPRAEVILWSGWQFYHLQAERPSDPIALATHRSL